MRRHHGLLFLGLVTTIALAGIALTAFGAGFQLTEQSGRGLGEAFAGAATSTKDASCIFYNPACMSRLEGPQFVAALHVIEPTFEFDNDGSSYPLAGGMPITGGDGGDGGVTALIPNLYYARAMNEDVSFGVGLHVPFGLETEYDSGWVGRYQGIKTELVTLNINPTVAWRVSDQLSLGAGLSAQHAEAELTSAVDFGGILASLGTPGVAPQMLDGCARMHGDDWGYGFNLGLLYSPTADSQVGLAYRSMIEYTLEGDAKFAVPPQAAGLNAMGLFVDTEAEADLELPETITAGYSQRMREDWTLLMSVLWTRWSRFEELRLEYDSAQPDSVTEEDWEDVFRVALGVNYEYSSAWTFRAGTAFDESPIPDAQHRTPRIPDADRIWLALGAGYQASDDLTIDASFVHLFFHDADVEHLGSTGDLLTGTYEGGAELISLQLTWNL